MQELEDDLVYGPGSVQRQLSAGVQALTATNGAFAARKDDGSVVAWGSDHAGGDSHSVQGQLAAGVHAIYSTEEAFAVRKTDGSVVAWGDPDFVTDGIAAAQ